MDKDLLGTRRLAVVQDEFEQCQDRMHLDCVFNILGKTCCVLAEDVIGADKPFRRTAGYQRVLVHSFVLHSRLSGEGGFTEMYP